jgi:hypothetical protein
MIDPPAAVHDIDDSAVVVSNHTGPFAVGAPDSVIALMNRFQEQNDSHRARADR